MNIEETRTEGKIQLTIQGRIDTTTCAQLQSAILVSFQKVNSLILDFQNVDYISSAGLRALLLGQKTANSKGGNMRLIHVQESVMQVLRMSGFSSILNIE